MPASDRPVVVVTGASSGIGRATAHELARRGAALVLTARDAEALREVAGECEALGARAHTVAADVTRDQEVQEVARQAIATWGRLDGWVNNAAVYLLGRFDIVPADVARRVLETNVLGYFNGGRAALRQFRKQGSGILINVDSINGAAPQPYSSVYVASKFAVRGWSWALRMELSLEGPHDIHVCNVMPAAIDTPIFQHSANYTGRRLRALDPTYPPEEVARTIADLIEKPQAEVIVGAAGRPFVAQFEAAPRAFEKTMSHYIAADHFAPGAAPATEGNLFRSTGPKSVTGGWGSRETGSRWALVAGVAAAGALVAALTLRASRRR